MRRLRTENKIDILCLQEVDLEPNYPSEILSFTNYQLEVEINSYKSRAAIYIYIKNDLNFVKQHDLEGFDSHLVIVDIVGQVETQIINVNRSLNHHNGLTAKEKFKSQLKLIKLACTANIMILGDFN